MTFPAFSLYRNAHGRLVYVSPDGLLHEGVQAVRAFPISDPSQGVSIVSAEGHELVWLDSMDTLPPQMRQQVAEALASREFMPEIQRIEAVSAFATPSVWQVLTDRGPTEFTLKGEEDIRRLAGQTLLVSDSHGIHYLLRDAAALDRHSRRLLDHFL
ncbi:DUF1854 domain-containing protein [Bordetella sp. BOR01]|uniref:cyanophycin metabolism-associated DUF1854 family protein n=1 Tax=Bordetella sp. BOR01 TaxID=2854779 RepID=UPI001C445007|nr:DUF1854 domain-containing protein [Bordetella sp. BOR01]MBV7482088.1 DUF1854 domain-containing protein [Bordetella sp. BOR01]